MLAAFPIVVLPLDDSRRNALDRKEGWPDLGDCWGWDAESSDFLTSLTPWGTAAAKGFGDSNPGLIGGFVSWGETGRAETGRPATGGGLGALENLELMLEIHEFRLPGEVRGAGLISLTFFDEG